jgi:hypothetical protein
LKSSVIEIKNHCTGSRADESRQKPRISKHGCRSTESPLSEEQKQQRTLKSNSDTFKHADSDRQNVSSRKEERKVWKEYFKGSG